ncbi:MAG: hypothetical protein IT374_14750 [Polyangiaceae bacterium]|nr:hypothetical protein [Polyangiaceae bacterium]
MRSTLLLLALSLVACDPTTGARPPKHTGEPAPTASTSAEPLWLSNQPRPAPAPR